MIMLPYIGNTHIYLSCLFIKRCNTVASSHILFALLILCQIITLCNSLFSPRLCALMAMKDVMHFLKRGGQAAVCDMVLFTVLSQCFL